MKKAVVEELHKPARRNYPRRKFDVRGIDFMTKGELCGIIRLT